MELEAHIRALSEAYEDLGRTGKEHERQQLDVHPFNPLHPDRWRAFGANVRAVGKATIEIVKLAPHLNEIRKLGNEKDS